MAASFIDATHSSAVVKRALAPLARGEYPEGECDQREKGQSAGQYANYCLFDAGSHDELHALVSGLPMYRYIHTEVEALAQHPNAVR